MIDVNQLNDGVLHDVLQNTPGRTEEAQLRDIGISSTSETFERYLTWTGIMGYTRSFWNALRNIVQAEIPGPHCARGFQVAGDGVRVITEEHGEVVLDPEPDRVYLLSRLEDGRIWIREWEEMP